jgi:gluconokinase
MVIVIMGPAGAGKTTIGRSLAVELGWRFVDGDEAHPAGNIEKMHAGIPLTDADREPWLMTLHTIAAQAIDRDEPTVIACSALKERYRLMLRGGLAPVRFVYLQATEAVLQHRLAARESHFFNPALLATQLAALEEPADALVVDASWPPERIVAAIRSDVGV